MTGATLAAVVALSGGIGAIGRYVVDAGVQRRLQVLIPAGTLVVNVIGSFILGIIAGIVAHHGVPDAWHAAVGIGFCGGLTTFSTSSFETVRLLRDGRAPMAVVVALGGVTTSLLAGALGLGLALL